MKYSQNNEEQFIVDYFGSYTGHLIDIGAYNGRVFSNTLKLIEAGWSGVCIEPDPIVFEDLKKLHEGNDKIKLIKAAFAATKGKVKFYSSGGDAISTTSDEHKNKWEAGWNVKYTELEVDKITYSDFAGKYDFVSLDVESTNWELLQLLPLGEMGTKLICVEHDNKEELILNYCSQFGLNKTILRNGENIIIAK